MNQLTRIKFFSALLAALAVLAWFTLQKRQVQNTITSGSDKIGIQDTASVNKVIIEKKTEKLVLTKKPYGWVVNGKYKTRMIASDMLMVGLNQLEIKRPVSDESKKEVIQLLKEKGAKVLVENPEGTKEFIFASNENDVNSTYLLIPGSETPYVAYVPGVPGDINNLFRFTENDWRSRIVFSSKPNHIQSLKISYPHNPSTNVEMSYNRGSFEVKGVAAPDTSVLYQFIPVFQDIQVSRYLNPDDSLISIAENSPLAIIELQDLDAEKSNTLSIFDTPGKQPEYLGKIGKTGEPAALRKDVFSQLLLKKNDFVKR